MQKQVVNVKEVEYDQYYCHPYSRDEGVMTCRTFYVTLVDLEPGDEFITDYCNNYSSIHLPETDDAINKACKSCQHRLTSGCDGCKALELSVQREVELRRQNTEQYKVRMEDMSVAAQLRAKAVKDANRNRLSRPQSDKLRGEATRMRQTIADAAIADAAQQATIKALEAELAIAQAAAVRYD